MSTAEAYLIAACMVGGLVHVVVGYILILYKQLWGKAFVSLAFGLLWMMWAIALILMKVLHALWGMA